MNWREFFSFKLELGYLGIFFAGVTFGFMFLLMFYFYTILQAQRNKNFYKKAIEPDIDAEEIKLLIKDAQSQFKNKKDRESIGLVNHLKAVSLELSKDIATKFYPSSKYPLLELTIQETLLLGHYITDRVDRLFDAKLLRIFRGKTLASIMSLYEVKEKVDDSAVMKVEKKLKVRKRIGDFFTAMNIANPAFWIKKVTVDKLTETITIKICLAIIGIVGEETYKIYSKNVFEVEKVIDTGVDSIYDEIQKETEKEDTDDEPIQS